MLSPRCSRTLPPASAPARRSVSHGSPPPPRLGASPGYQANSVVLANTLIGELNAVRDLRAAASGPAADSGARSEADAAMATVLDGIVRVVAAVLVRDINAVARLGSQATVALPGLSADHDRRQRRQRRPQQRRGFRGDRLPGEPEQPRRPRRIRAPRPRRDRAHAVLDHRYRAAAATAIASLDRAATTLLNAGVVDTFNLVDNLAHVVEDIVPEFCGPTRRCAGPRPAALRSAPYRAAR